MTGGPGGEVLDALAEQHAELAALLAGLTEADWQRPSLCEGWTVADVVLHLAQTDRLAIGSATDQYAEAIVELSGGPASNVDEGADRMVAQQRGLPGEEIGRRWASTAAEMRRTFAASDPHKRVQWVAGDMTARTLATTRLSECWIHTGDVAFAFRDDRSKQPAPTDRLWHIARLAYRTIPYAFARAGRSQTGEVAFELVGPSGDAWYFRPPGGAEAAATTIAGPALDLCLVAGRRAEPGETGLVAEGPDAAAVLELVRTYA